MRNSLRRGNPMPDDRCAFASGEGQETLGRNPSTFLFTHLQDRAGCDIYSDEL